MVQQITKPRAPRVDTELEEFRSLMEVPSTFEEGFNWKSLVGALFIALMMVPGSIYMGLLAGADIGPAARWVTVILFVEVARRAQSQLKRPEIFILYYMAGAAIGAPFFGLLWNQFYANSQAAQATGIASHLPYWFAPALDSTSYMARTFFHPDWLPVIGMIAFTTIFSSLSHMILGYGLFRLTSDIEKLPFPMAPIDAQGVMALAEDSGEKEGANSQNWRWRVFAIGGAIGLAFGSIYLLLPTITGALTGTPIQLFMIPFADTTAKSQQFLPAVATGLCWDMGNILVGMVLPFFAIVGSFIGLICTVIANPILYRHGMLPSWNPGDDTIATIFHNNMDFYLSFGIGLALAIAAVGFYQMVKGIRSHLKNAKSDAKASGMLETPKGRGDIKARWIIACYFLVTLSYILVSGYLIHWHPGVMIVLVFFGFFYTPIISYVTARLEGIAGQVVEIPFIREASLILSGFKGVQVWFLPIPMTNYGAMTVLYRQCELTGTRFTSIWKTVLIITPIVMVSSFFFMNYIWSLGPVPSPVYPYAQRMWELNALNSSIVYTSTMEGEFSEFEKAFNPTYIAFGAGIGIFLFAGLSALGAPLFMIYGVVRGLNNPMPHYLIPQLVGALIGRFYFQRRLGLNWRQFIPVVMAGFSCGMGLISMLGIGVTFLSKAVVQLPY